MPIPPSAERPMLHKNRRRVEDFLKVPTICCGGRAPYCRCLGSVESQHLDLVTGCVNSLVKTLLAINIVNLRKKNVMSILCDECAPNKLGLTPHYPGVWIYPTIPTIHISPVPWQLRPIHRLTPLQHAYAERLDLPICVQLSLPVRHNELSP
jgi:hypothetical protein